MPWTRLGRSPSGRASSAAAAGTATPAAFGVRAGTTTRLTSRASPSRSVSSEFQDRELMGAEGERRGVTARGPGPKPAPRRTTPEFRPKQRRPTRPTPNSRRTNRPPTDPFPPGGSCLGPFLKDTSGPTGRVPVEVDFEERPTPSMRRCRTRSNRPGGFPHTNNRTWSTARPPSSHAAAPPRPIHRGGLPHLDDAQTTLRASFSKSIEGDDAGSLRTSHQCGSVAVPFDRWH